MDGEMRSSEAAEETAFVPRLNPEHLATAGFIKSRQHMAYLRGAKSISMSLR